MQDLSQCIQKAARMTHLVCGVTNHMGQILACSDYSKINKEDLAARDLVLTKENMMVSGEFTYSRVPDNMNRNFVCFIEGNDHNAQTYVQLLSCWVAEIVKDGNTELVRQNFLKNVLLENELPGDVSLKAREFRIPYGARRVAVLLHLTNGRVADYLPTLKPLLPNSRTDFLLAMDEENVIFLIEVGPMMKPEVENLVDKIEQGLPEMKDKKAVVGVGMVADNLKDCAKSYREASLALTVGSIFSPDASVMHYDKLGLGRLIYQLPVTLCQMFLEEVLPNNAYVNLDDETIETIGKFFENNLNGSETARQLFVHRNTLVYRLDKVQKITDLDLRNFDDAVLFKLAFMVRKYLEKQDIKVPGFSSRWWRN